MSEFILGLSFGFHDASAAIVSREGVLAFAAEERLSRQKHDASFPRFAIEECLSQLGLKWENIAQVAYHERPEPAFTRVLTTALAGFPHSAREFSASMRTWLSQKLWVRSEIARRIKSQKSLPIALFPHHDCHAAQSYFTSGYDESAILTLDAVGEWTSTGLFKGQDHELIPLKAVKFPHSLGLFYSAMTAYLGFAPMDSECSTMALSAFGRPLYADFFRTIVQLDVDGFAVDQSYFRFVEFYQKPYAERLVQVLGPPRSPFDSLGFSSWGRTEVTADEQRFADIAASVQLVYEEAVLHLAALTKRLTGSKRLCLAGGGAMNSVAVRKLVDAKIFDDIYVPPDPGDGGAAAGAALLCLAKAKGLLPSSQWRADTGFAVRSEDLGFVNNLSPAHARRYSKIGLVQEPFAIEETTFTEEEGMVDEVADAIAKGQIVGWCQGRFEAGPRALGQRSLLIRPDRIDLAQRLSRDVKSRAAFRPYALSLREEEAALILNNYQPQLRPYQAMQIVDKVEDSYRESLKAGLHIDQTTRPQVVKVTESPRYHALLTAVHSRLGVGALINTSFNESGYPIVHTAREALAIFLRSGMDVLVVDKTIYRKKTIRKEVNA